MSKTELPLAHERIRQAILARLGREFPAGAKLPPGTELAKQMGFGHRNTYRALFELARDGFLVSRPRLGTVVARDIDRLLRQAPESGPLAGKRIAIITVPTPAPFIRTFAAAARQRLRRAGASVQLIPQKQTGPYRLKGLPHIDAFIVVNPGPFNRIIADDPGNVVVISTNSTLADTMNGRMNVVTVDDENGGMLAGAALREMGCASACFVAVRDVGDPGMYDDLGRLRLRGFTAGWGAAIPETHQITTTAYCDTSGARAFADYMRLNPRPQGVFAASDEIAYGFMLAAMGCRLESGRDFHLVGFDGQYFTPHQGHGYLFNSVAVPAREMGAAAARIIGQRLTDPASSAQRVTFTCAIRLADAAARSPATASTPRTRQRRAATGRAPV